ncbi:MAG TPA: hypothetical protein VE981_06545 [Planctomycetota bacterium]|nr:hypothetical protein [Planctomycetota bacterium]
MGDDKKKGGGGGFKFGSAMIWAGGQWAVNWFLFPDMHLWTIVSASISAFFAGLSTSAILGRFAKWGANAWVMMLLGVLVGVAIFSGAFTGLTAAFNWWNAKDVKVDWDKLQAFLLSWSVVPPAGFGLLTGLYVRSKTPKGKQ